ncbi:DUF4118 domain-containing protein [Novosphingobium sp. MW5]|nr:DUF4118 domain-containing protein [Novosphingobium sp. MW5]
MLAVPDRNRPLAIKLAACSAALLLVALSTAVGLYLASRWGNSPVVMLYLLPVLAAAIYGGLGPGLVAAVASALAYNYWFTAPLHTFVIHEAADIVTVVVLFLGGRGVQPACRIGAKAGAARFAARSAQCGYSRLRPPSAFSAKRSAGGRSERPAACPAV